MAQICTGIHEFHFASLAVEANAVLLIFDEHRLVEILVERERGLSTLGKVYRVRDLCHVLERFHSWKHEQPSAPVSR